MRFIIISNAPKLELKKWENLSNKFYKSSLAGPNTFLFLFLDHLPFIVIENIDKYVLSCKI